jgi:hypothetical protein
MLDRGLETPVTLLKSSDAVESVVTGGGAPQLVAGWFASRGDMARVLVLLPGHTPGRLSRWFERFHRIPSPGDGIAAQLIASGSAALVTRYELPQGRRYALMGPPHP